MARAAGTAPAAGRESAGMAALTRRGFARGAAAAAALAIGSAALGAAPGLPVPALADEAGGRTSPAGGIDTSTEGEQTYSEAGLLYVARDGYAVVAGPDGDAPEALAIPAELGGLPVLAVGDRAFRFCNSLASVKLPQSLVAIGDGAFNNCSSLASVRLPGSLETVGARAFYGCSSLASVEFPDSLASIGEYAFSNCSSLASVRLPGSLETVGAWAFAWCDSLASVRLPASVASVGAAAFGSCRSLASIDVDPESAALADIDGVLFEKATKRLVAYPAGRPGDSYDVPEGIAEVGGGAFYGCGNLTAVGLPGSLVAIGENAFVYCDSLTSVVLPASVASVGDGAFLLCDSLTSIDVDPGNAAYASVDGVLFDRDMTALLAYPEGRPGDSYDVPEGIEEVGAEAFYGCRSLTAVRLPESLVSIGDYAFQECGSLASVVLPASLASIGDGAFQYCGSLTSVTVPASVTHIGDEAFAQCPVTFTVERGSYAAQWARDHGADYEYADALDWLQAPGGQDGDDLAGGDATSGDQAGGDGTADTADSRLILSSLAR